MKVGALRGVFGENEEDFEKFFVEFCVHSRNLNVLCEEFSWVT